MKGQYVMVGFKGTKKLEKYHLIMELTKSCSLGKCKHCYVEGIRRTNSVMKPETVKRVLEEFASIAKRESEEKAIAHFKGGEPLDYPYLKDVALHAASLGLEVFITTNGLAVAEKIELLKQIRDASNGNMRVTLSLNGSKPEVDALLRVDPAYYYKTLEAAKVLRAAKIIFDINCVVHEGNVEDIREMVALTKELGASQLNMLQLILVGRAANGGVKKAKPEKLLKALFAVYNDGDKRTRALMVGSLPNVIEQIKKGECSGGCVAGYRGLLYLRSDGSAFSCPNTVNDEFLAGNIRSSNVKELMDSNALVRLRLKDSLWCKGDILSGGEYVKKLGEAIRSMIGVVEETGKATCAQRNW